MSFQITAWFEIEKFLEYSLNKRISNRDKSKRKMLSGKFKVNGSDKIIEGDIFLAYELSGCNAFEVYQCYVKYFNHTRKDTSEKERIAVSAEWIEKPLIEDDSQ